MKRIDKVLIKSLLFVNSIANKGHIIVFDSNKSLMLSKINPKNTIAWTIRRVPKNDFYKIDIQIVGSAIFKRRHKLIRLWHERLGHIGVQSMKCLKNQNVAQRILALDELDALKIKFYI
jgi:predicted acetyltransferase